MTTDTATTLSPPEAPRQSGADSPAGPPRDVAFDAFRGLAIALVVFAHAQAFGWGFQNEGSWLRLNFYYSVIGRDIAVVALPLFLFISAYFLGRTRITSREEYWQFLRKRVSRVAIPYVIWSTVFILWSDARAHSFTVSGFAFKLLLGQADGPYFFIVMLLQFYLLTPLFVRWSQSRKALLTLIGLHVLVVAVLYALRVTVLKDLSFSYVKLPFFVWLSIFPLGVFIRNNPGVPERISMRIAASLTALFLLVSFAETFVLLHFLPCGKENSALDFAISDIKFSSLAYAAAAILVLIKLRHRQWPRIFVLLSDYAFGIFFIHGIILRALGKVVMDFPALNAIQPLSQTIIAVGAITLSCAIIFATRKAIGLENARKWLGF